LAAKLICSGTSEGASINVLRALMDSSVGPRDERWQARYNDIPRSVETAAVKYRESGEDNEEPVALPFIDYSRWDNEPTPDRDWAVQDRIPLRQTALFTGEGGSGKSSITLHQCCAHVLGRDWLGSLPEIGPAIFIDAEDDENEIHIRLSCIARHYAVRRTRRVVRTTCRRNMLLHADRFEPSDSDLDMVAAAHHVAFTLG
jgi:AAA domain